MLPEKRLEINPFALPTYPSLYTSSSDTGVTVVEITVVLTGDTASSCFSLSTFLSPMARRSLTASLIRALILIVDPFLFVVADTLSLFGCIVTLRFSISTTPSLASHFSTPGKSRAGLLSSAFKDLLAPPFTIGGIEALAAGIKDNPVSSFAVTGKSEVVVSVATTGVEASTGEIKDNPVLFVLVFATGNASALEDNDGLALLFAEFTEGFASATATGCSAASNSFI